MKKIDPIIVALCACEQEQQLGGPGSGPRPGQGGYHKGKEVSDMKDHLKSRGFKGPLKSPNSAAPAFSKGAHTVVVHNSGHFDHYNYTPNAPPPYVYTGWGAKNMATHLAKHGF